MTTELNQGTPLSVAPGLLVGDINSRFALKRSRIETMKASIIERGGIMVPLEVEPLEAPLNGAKYRITDGHYRHAAVTELLKDYDGLECPIIVREVVEGETAVERLKRQTAFNYEREGLSPMDIAVAAKSMMDAGESRAAIRAVFKRGGGRKGAKVQDLSNAALNMYVSFLDFPKDIQKKVHDGLIGVAAAYKLTLKPKEKWAEIVSACEKDREDELKAEEEREDRYLDSLKKDEEKAKALTEAAEAAKAAKAKADEAAKLKSAKVEAETAALAVFRAATGEEKKKAEESFKAAGADAVGAVKALEEATKEAQKADAKLKKYNDEAEARKKKLEAIRSGASDKPAKPIGATQVDKAAKKVGGSDKVKLNATDMRKAVEEWALPGTAPTVQKIAAIIMQCFNSDLTPAQAYTEMAKVTGEGSKKSKK
jgi:hypothetical protein